MTLDPKALVSTARLEELVCRGTPASSEIHDMAVELISRRAYLASAKPAGEVGEMNITRAARDVLAERRRQVEAERWSPAHDDTHTNGEMAIAAACYALSASGWSQDALSEIWPKGWGVRWLKPKTSRRDLVRAAALIVAEIERLDRRETIQPRTDARYRRVLRSVRRALQGES